MNKKLIIALAVICYIIGFVVQVISLFNKDNLSNSMYLVSAFSSAIPLASCVTLISMVLPPKLNVLKIILRIYAGIILFAFIIACVAA